MDDPAVAPREHLAALDGLRWINRLSLTVGQLWRPIRGLVAQHPRSLSLIDVACGGGDVPIALARRLVKRQVRTRLILMDRSPAALSRAGENAAGLACECLCADALDGELPPADVVICTLFLHHLDAPDAVRLLRRMDAATRQLLCVSDLRRCRMGWSVANVACRMSRSPLVRHDGPVSVRAAWTVRELQAHCASAGMSNAAIRRCWPWRMLLVRRK